MRIAFGATNLDATHEERPVIDSLTAPRFAGALKFGQRVPESNLVSELNTGAPQQTQRYIPASFSLLGMARSVPLPRHVELLGRKLAAPLLLRDCDLGLIRLSASFSFVHRWNTSGLVRIYWVGNIVIGDVQPKRALRRSRKVEP